MNDISLYTVTEETSASTDAVETGRLTEFERAAAEKHLRSERWRLEREKMDKKADNVLRE